MVNIWANHLVRLAACALDGLLFCMHTQTDQRTHSGQSKLAASKGRNMCFPDYYPFEIRPQIVLAERSSLWRPQLPKHHFPCWPNISRWFSRANYCLLMGCQPRSVRWRSHPQGTNKQHITVMPRAASEYNEAWLLKRRNKCRSV